MITLNSPFGGAFPASGVIITIAVIYYLIWLLVLGAALLRHDLEPVTRLMWVIVIIFVPVFGILMYAFLAPERRLEQKRDRTINVASPASGTPWEDDPGHTSRPNG